MKNSLYLTTAFVLLCALAHSQYPERISGFPVPSDGEIRAIEIDEENQRMYIGGDFTKLQSGRDFSALLDAEDNTSISDFPYFDGAVYVSESDQNGGLFIGGSFTKVGNFERTGLVHIDAQGQITAFQAQINGVVKALLFDGEQLFVGGRFTEVNGQERLNAFSINFSNWQLTGFAPKVQGDVNAFEEQGENIFIGGKFKHVGNVWESGLVIDTELKQPVESFRTKTTTWGIRKAISDGNGGWFIHGNFTMVGDSARDGLAHIDQFGNPTAWNCGEIELEWYFDVLTLKDDALYIGGRLTSVGGQLRGGVAKLSALTGEVLPWNPNLQNGAPWVWSIAFHDSSVYLGGRFGFNGIEGLVKVDEEDGQVDVNFDLNLDGPSFSRIHSVAVNESDLYFQGDFTHVLGIERGGAAMINLSTSELSSFEMSFGGTYKRVNDFVFAGDTMYVAGRFYLDSEFSSSGIAAYLLPDHEEINLEIEALEIRSIAATKSDIYLEGWYMSLEDGTDLRSLVSFRRGTQELNSFALSGGGISDLAFDSNNDRLFIGTYSQIYMTLAQNERGNIAQFTKEGEKLAFDLKIESQTYGTDYLFDDAISDILLFNDSILYVSGGFEQNSPIDHKNFLTSINLNTGIFVDSPIPNGPVTTLAKSENNLLFGGDFSKVDGSNRSNLALWDTETSELHPFNIGTDNLVRRIMITDNNLLVCGDFFQINDIYESSAAILDIHTLELIPIPFNPKGSVYDVNLLNGSIFMGGTYLGLGPKTNRLNFAAIDLISKEIIDFTPNPNGIVHDILIDEDRLIVAGSFTAFEGTDSEPIVFLDRTTYAESEWNPPLFFDDQSVIVDVETDGDNVYVIGDFTSFPFQTQTGIVAIRKSDETVLDWPSQALDSFDPSSDVFLTCLSSNGSVFIGGDFDVELNGENRKDFLEVNQVTGEFTDFELDLESPYCSDPDFDLNPKVNAIYGIAGDNDDFITVLGDFRIRPCEITATGPYASDVAVKGIMRVNRATGEVRDYGAGIPARYSNWSYTQHFFSYFNVSYGTALARHNDKIYFGGVGWLGEIDTVLNSFTDWYGSGYDWGTFMASWYLDGWGTPLPPDWSAIYSAYDIEIADGMMYVGGDFENISGSTASRLAVYKLDCGVNGGLISTESITQNICLNDQSMNPILVDVEGSKGFDAEILVDFTNNMIDYSPNVPFNMDNYEPGNYYIANAAVQGVNANTENLNDLRGCFDLSNFIPVSTFRAQGGEIEAVGPTQFCVAGDDLTTQLSVAESSGPNQGWLLLDGDLTEILLSNADGNFDLSGLGTGTFKAVHYSMDAQMQPADIIVDDLPDCFNYSNAIKIKVNACDEGIITTSPNPVTDLSNVTFQLVEDANATLELYDLNGRLIETIYSGQALGENQYKFDVNVNHLSPGVYIYQLNTGKEIKTVKFLKN